MAKQITAGPGDEESKELSVEAGDRLQCKGSLEGEPEIPVAPAALEAPVESGDGSDAPLTKPSSNSSKVEGKGETKPKAKAKAKGKKILGAPS